MTRFYGKVGYVLPSQLINDVYVPNVVEHVYYGDIPRQYMSNVPSDKVNNDPQSQDQISIVADEYAVGNYRFIKYVIRDGVRWEVTSVSPQRPRLVLSLGGVYDGRTPED